MQSENKLVFTPVEIDREEDEIFYEYQFKYSSDQLNFNFTFDLGKEFPVDNNFVEVMKNNETYSIEGEMCNGEVRISTENGLTSFSLAKYGDSASGSNNFSLKNELCLEAIEAWLNHWRDNSEY
jgi:hypothetical protein